MLIHNLLKPSTFKANLGKLLLVTLEEKVATHHAQNPEKPRETEQWDFRLWAVQVLSQLVFSGWRPSYLWEAVLEHSIDDEPVATAWSLKPGT